MQPEHAINSRAWWDSYFRHQWDANDGSAQTAYFMERLLEGLRRRDREHAYLASRPLEILDWGCAFGEGAQRLSETFPLARVAGLDFAEEAIRVAHRRYPAVEFHQNNDGRIPHDFDVVVTSNCLEHFDDPIAVASRHIRSCRRLYLAMVPYREEPLCSSHRARFDERTFPETLGGFLRLFCEIIPTEAPFWNGKQLLVAYGSRNYLDEVAGTESQRGSGAFDVSARERAKWDAYYASIVNPEESPASLSFGDELASRLSEILPEGGRVLEAGSGAGHQSMALSRARRYELTLMDFSEQALDQARRWFGREGVSAEFVTGDVLSPGREEFDLVFNAGVLEHYTFDEQVRFLHGMASRSRRFVLALVPNRLCYWYWIGRVRAAAGGDWPFGKEAPMTDLAPAFEAAGLTFLGQFVGGATWSENFINYLPGLDDALRELILSVHRSPIIPAWQKGYLVGALGVKGERPALSAAWSGSWPTESFAASETTATIADSLALAIAGEQRLKQGQRDAEALRAKTEAEWTVRLDAERAQRDLLCRRHEEREAELAARVAAISQCLDERGRVIEGLTNQLNQTTTAHEQERHAAEQTFNDALARLQAAERQIEALSWWTSVQDNELKRINGGKAGKLLGALRAFRRAVAPVGSPQARAAGFGLRVFRKARQGPRPFSRAVARRVLVRLPESWRGRARGLLHRPTRSTSLPGPPLTLEQDGSRPAFGSAGLVSVILPVFNQADLLAASIESVLAQSYPNFELIIVNDGSTDGVEAVLDEYLDHPKVRVLTQANQKLPKALSNGFEFAQGEFWTWTSADNLMGTDQLARQVAFLQSHPSVAMVYADYEAIDDRGEPLRDPNWRPHNRRAPDSSAIHLPRSTAALNTVLDNFIGPCFMYRGWVGRLIGEYDPNLGLEDYDYWMWINAQFLIAHLGDDETLYRYRVHDNSLSGRAAELRIAEKALKLLDYERERSEFYGDSWTIVTDAKTRELIGPVVSDRHAVIDWAGGPLTSLATGKSLAILGASSLEALAASGRPDAMLMAAWFDAEATDSPYQHRATLNALNATVFVGDEQARERAALLGLPAFVAPRSELAGVVLRWANNKAFHERTRPESVRRRELPRVHAPAGRRYRVLLQVNDFTQGGMERVVLSLAKELDPRRVQFTLLVLGRQGDAIAEARAARLRVVTLPEDERETHYRSLLTEERIDLVHAHFSLFGAEIADELGVPFLQTFHGTPVSIDPAHVRAIQKADEATTAHVCVSNEVARYADIRLGLPPSKILVLPNGVEVAKFAAMEPPADREAFRRSLGFGPDDFVFLNVGSIYADKAQIPAVLALAEVAKERPGVKLVLLGKAIDGEYLADLRRVIDRQHLGNAVRIVGHSNDPARFYRAADAFLFPSYWEGWSLALAEALCAGLPVVATAVGAASELVTSDLGWLVKPPYRSVTELDWLTIGPVVRRHDRAFIARLSQAMQAAVDRPGRVRLPFDVLRAIDQRHSCQAYAELYAWLAQGGRPSAARAWRAARRLGALETALPIEGIRAA